MSLLLEEPGEACGEGEDNSASLAPLAPDVVRETDRELKSTESDPVLTGVREGGGGAFLAGARC